jgi:predicted  nucleic acid-binding Zn-ribbon protein
VSDDETVDGELSRLRALLGPDEESYADLRRQRDGAEAHARDLEQQLGVLRGHVKRLDQIMWRRTARRERIARLARRFIRR